MAESIKYKKPDTYHDADNVYDFEQKKTQANINSDTKSKLMNTINKINYTSIPNATNGELLWTRIGNLVWLQLSALNFSTQKNVYAITKLTFASVGLPEAIVVASGFLSVSGKHVGELYTYATGALEIRTFDTNKIWGQIVYVTSSE